MYCLYLQRNSNGYGLAGFEVDSVEVPTEPPVRFMAETIAGIVIVVTLVIIVVVVLIICRVKLENFCCY